MNEDRTPAGLYVRIVWIAIKLAVVIQLGTAAAARFAYEGF